VPAAATMVATGFLGSHLIPCSAVGRTCPS
jgi:hypothetical protein